MAHSGVVSKKESRSRSIADKELDKAQDAVLKEKYRYVEIELRPGWFLAVGTKFTYGLKSDGVHGAINLTNLSDGDAAELINAREDSAHHLETTIARLLAEVPQRAHEAQG